MMNREATQRRITGYANRPYQWADRPERREAGRPQQPVRRRAPEPRENREAQYKRYVGYRNNVVIFAAIIFILTGVVARIVKVTEIASQRKRINAIYEENKTLTAEIEALEVQLCMETRPSIIKQRASTMGMITPAESETCVLRTVVRRTTDTAQTAENVTGSR